MTIYDTPSAIWKGHILPDLNCLEIVRFGSACKFTNHLISKTDANQPSFWEIQYKNKFGKEVPVEVKDKDCYARIHLLIDENLKAGRIYSSKENQFSHSIHLVKANLKNFPTHWLYLDRSDNRWKRLKLNNSHATRCFTKAIEEERLAAEQWSLDKDVSSLPIDPFLATSDLVISAGKVTRVVKPNQMEKMEEGYQAFIGGKSDGSIHVSLFHGKNKPTEDPISLDFLPHTAGKKVYALACGDGYFFSAAADKQLKRHCIKIFYNENGEIHRRYPICEGMLMPDDVGHLFHLAVKAGKLFAAGTQPFLYAWDIETRSLIGQIELSDKNTVTNLSDVFFMGTLCASEDRVYVAFGVTANSQKLEMRDLNSLALIKEARSDKPKIKSLSSCGPTLFSGHDDGTIRAWNRDLDCIFTFPKPYAHSIVDKIHIKEGILCAKYIYLFEQRELLAKTAILFWTLAALSHPKEEQTEQMLKDSKLFQ